MMNIRDIIEEDLVKFNNKEYLFEKIDGKYKGIKFNEFIEKSKKKGDKKEIYVLQLAWSNQDSEGINTTLFDDREKAIKKFKEIIEEEKTLDWYWSSDAFDKDGNLISDEYELDTNVDDPNAVEFYWELRSTYDSYNHDSLQLYIKGIE